MGVWELYKDHNVELEAVKEKMLKTTNVVEMIKSGQGRVTILMRELGLLKMLTMKGTCCGRLEIGLHF